MIDKCRLSHTGTFRNSREKIAHVMTYFLALPVLKRMSFICHYVGTFWKNCISCEWHGSTVDSTGFLPSNAEMSNIEVKSKALQQYEEILCFSKY